MRVTCGNIVRSNASGTSQRRLYEMCVCDMQLYFYLPCGNAINKRFQRHFERENMGRKAGISKTMFFYPFFYARGKGYSIFL